MPSRFRQSGPSAGLAIADRLHSAAIHLLRSLREVDRRFGLSAPRLSALSVIVFRGPLSMTALASAEQVSKPTMTRLVAELERAGLVERSRGEGDRRVQSVRVTPKGRATLEAGRRLRVERLATALKGLKQGDRVLLGRAADLMEELVRPGGTVAR